MKKYLSFFRLRFIHSLAYRSAAAAGIVTQFAWGFMNLLMYRAFYAENAASFPMEFDALSNYIWLQQAFLALFMAWYFDGEILEGISSGNVCYELCRPCDIYTMWYAKNAAVRLARAVLRCMPILLVAILLPQPLGLTAPRDIGAAAMFTLSLLLGFSVMVSYSMVIYGTVFYTISSLGVRILSVSIVEFLAGAIIPLPFFPEGVRRVVELLPFASMQNAPFMIYSGSLAGEAALRAIATQAVWLIALYVAGKLLMKRALKRVVIQGG